MLVVWMRDLLGVSDDLEGLRQSVWIGWLVAPVGKLRLGRPGGCCTTCSGEAPLEHALASPIVGLIEALEQRLKIPMAIDGDARAPRAAPAR